MKIFVNMKVPRGDAELINLAALTRDVIPQSGCDPLIATHEIAAQGLAYAHEISSWLCYKSGLRVSNSALGCAEITIEYASLEDLQKKLFENLKTNGTRMTQI